MHTEMGNGVDYMMHTMPGTEKHPMMNNWKLHWLKIQKHWEIINLGTAIIL